MSILLCAALFASVVFTADNTEIVANDPKDAFAAQELKTLLGEAFGAEIPVVEKETGAKKPIALECDASFERDQIRLVTTADGVRIVSGAARVYGVYEFLERSAGMRFYFPGPLGTIVPKRASLEVPEGTVDVKPDYTQRSCDMSWGRNGRWYDPDGLGEATGSVMTSLWRTAQARMRLAPRIPCCHGQNTMFHLYDRFSKTHPEYFALLKDKDGNFYRDDENSKWQGHRGHLCHTGPVWEQIYRDAVEKVRAGEKYIDVMAQDGMQRCLCEACEAAYSKDPDDPNYATELMWRNTANLARRLTADGLDAYVTQMAYTPYNRIPEIDLPPNVLVMIARRGPWSKGTPGQIEKENAGVRAWVKKLGHKVWLWNYAYKNLKRNVDIPQMTPHAIGEYYAGLSDAIIGSYMESRTDRWIYNYLNYYVYNKVCWDNKVDINALIAEHDRLMFGAGAPEMHAYYERLEELWINKFAGNCVETDLGPMSVEPTPYQRWVDIYTPAVIAEFDGYLARAAAKVPAGSLEARRIAFIRYHFFDPMKRASDAYLDTVDAARNSVKRAGRENRSVLKGTRFDAPEEIVVDGDTPRFKSAEQPLTGLLKPNTKYLVSYFVSFTNAVSRSYGGGVRSVFSDGTKQKTFPSPAERIGSRPWHYQEHEFTTSSEIGEKPFVRIEVGGAAGKAWFKGVRVEEVK